MLIVASMSRKWIGSGRIRCIVLKEKGSKAEEKIHEFVLQSGLNRTVLIVSYEVAVGSTSHLDVPKVCRCDQHKQGRFAGV